MERQSWRKRLGALRNLPPFLRLVWQTSPTLAVSQGLLRVLRALLPVITLYVGKLIIDDVVHLVQMPNRPNTLEGWWATGQLHGLGALLLAARSAIAEPLVDVCNLLCGDLGRVR